MILSGDEVLRTQRGNNNAYCQDNQISWFDWRLVEKNAEMLRFVQALNAFRRRQPNIRRGAFLTGKAAKPGQLPDVSWFNPDGTPVNWSSPGSSLTCVFGTSGVTDPAARAVLVMLHCGPNPQQFTPPPPATGINWRLFIDTAAATPDDIYPDADGPSLCKEPVVLDAHTLRCYVAE
jgi:isoamylase